MNVQIDNIRAHIDFVRNDDIKVFAKETRRSGDNCQHHNSPSIDTATITHYDRTLGLDTALQNCISDTCDGYLIIRATTRPSIASNARRALDNGSTCAAATTPINNILPLRVLDTNHTRLPKQRSTKPLDVRPILPFHNLKSTLRNPRYGQPHSRIPSPSHRSRTNRSSLHNLLLGPIRLQKPYL